MIKQKVLSGVCFFEFLLKAICFRFFGFLLKTICFQNLGYLFFYFFLLIINFLLNKKSQNI